MEKTVDNLETLELKLKGISSLLQLIAEANSMDSDYSHLNVDAIQFLGEAIEEVSERYIRDSIERLVKKK